MLCEYMASQFLSINSLFKTDAQYDIVKQYLRTRRVPEGVSARFVANYEPFELRANKVIYTPADLEIVKKGDIPALLQNIYDDKTKGLGKGVLGLYKYICLHYGNISRVEVQNWLTKQPDYISAQPRPNRVNKPFTSKRVGELFCVDLIDLNPYLPMQRTSKKHRYILTVIDLFSRRVFLGMLADKTTRLH